MKKIFTFILSITILVSTYAQPAGWTHTQPIQVKENSGTTIPEYQLKITFDTQTPIGLGEMNPNGDDIRFGTGCDVINLNYWIESGINTTNTIIWVKMDTLFANQVKYINMFYGNPAAPAAGSISTTFYGPHSGIDSLNYPNTGGVTNSQRGFRFYPNEDILVTAFGKNEPTGTSRYITLFDVTTQGILRQHQVSGPAAQYSYSNMASPIWLLQGTQYLLEMYQDASDGYYFGAGPQVGQHLTYLDMRYCNGCNQNTYPNNYLNSIQYGYPDMWYYTKTNVTPAPTYNYTNIQTGFLGDDVDACMEYTIEVPYDGATYLWSDASSGQTLYVSNSGQYFVSGVTAQNCAYADTINVNIHDLPLVNLGADTIICNSTIVLDAQNPGGTYLWNDASTLQTLVTGSSADYFVQVTDTNGCINSDTVNVMNAPLPNVVGSITPAVACYGDSVLFDATGAENYTWTNVITNGLHPVFDDLNYTVTGTDTNGCVSFDTVEVWVHHLPVVNFTCSENVVCLTYAPVVISGGTPAGGVYSGTGISGGNFLPSTGVGTYLLSYTYTDANNCTVTAIDDITVLPCLNTEESSDVFFNIYPNPSNGDFILDPGSFNNNVELTIYDILGKVVYTNQLQSKTQTIYSRLGAGVYKLQLSDEDHSLTKTIIIR